MQSFSGGGSSLAAGHHLLPDGLHDAFDFSLLRNDLPLPHWRSAQCVSCHGLLLRLLREGGGREAGGQTTATERAAIKMCLFVSPLPQKTLGAKSQPAF